MLRPLFAPVRGGAFFNGTALLFHFPNNYGAHIKVIDNGFECTKIVKTKDNTWMRVGWIGEPNNWFEVEELLRELSSKEGLFP